MKLTCPNDATHTSFITTAHVLQQWEIDENGEFSKEIKTLDTVHGPDYENKITCAQCHVDAIKG